MAKFNLAQIKNKQDFPPVLLLYGADTFTMDETLSKLLQILITTEDDKIDFMNLDGDEIEQSMALNAASQLPMMSERKVVVVRRFDKLFKERRKKSNSTSSFAKYLDNPNKTTVLILLVDSSESKLDVSKYPYDIITKNHQSCEFPAVYEKNLPNWVVKRFSEIGKNINLETAELIVSQTPPNLRSLANEIEKISLFEPETKDITYDYVLKIIGSSRQNNVFELTNAVTQRDIEKSIKITLNILAISSQEILIITLIRDLFIKLWKLIELNNGNHSRDDMAKKIGLYNSYFLNDYLLGIKKYSPEDINHAFTVLCETDKRIKSSNSNSKLLIEEMLIKIIQPTS